MQGVEDAAFAFDRACRAAGVRYAFVGGIAVMGWGQPRATADVDVLIDLAPSQDDAFVAALFKEGLELDPRDLRDARDDRSHVTIHHPPSTFHVDLKLATTPEERDEIAGGVVVELGRGRVVIPSPEQVIAYKLLYGTPQDVADARSILVRQEGRLDLPGLRDLASRLGVAEALAQLLSER